MKLKKKPTAAVVATAHTPLGLQVAARLRPGALDFVEIRADCLAACVSGLPRRLERLRVPVLLTVRHPAEGGAGNLRATERVRLFEQLLPWASAIDVELRSAAPMQGVLAEAKRRGAPCIISFHNFRATPDLAALRRVTARAAAAGADIVKIATHLRGPRDLVLLLQLQANARRPLATMGMGPLGRVSRLALAAAGSRLNYGYLGSPQVEGQWPAAELAALLGKVVP
ncbi:MAG: type I 3-dehydroquinate dehydratase [Chthoniobacterales bacterium]|nr:type I 3-dehydroquinate dehydratase [Chthoniobacterales bacterium]